MGWDQILGHDLPRRQLEAAKRRGRLGHAYLFAGPSGVGKALFAREFAKSLLCDKQADNALAACGSCSSCALVKANHHPDLSLASRPEDKLELPIEVIRELGEHLSLTPARGRHRVVILNDADDLNDASANCFLKTLEEPPPGAVLILIGSDPERQLPTILSRCQVIRFAPLPADVMDKVLAEHGNDDPAQRARLVRLSGGSLGQALALNDPALWAFRGRLLRGLSAEKPETVALAGEWVRFCQDAGKEAAAKRGRAALVLRLLSGLLENALRLSVGSELPGDDADESARLKKLADRLGPERLGEWLDRCFEADSQINRRVQLELILESLMDALGRAR